jgi:sugar/nucleoside kinase (ribokinase family)
MNMPLLVVCKLQPKSAADAAVTAVTDSSYTDDSYTEARLYRAAPASAVVDCTGAGDCLAAAVAHGESLGMPIAASVQIGLVCAARSVASPQVRCSTALAIAVECSTELVHTPSV